MKYTTKRIYEPGLNVVIKNSNDFKTLTQLNPENIQVVYLNWTADETRLLAQKYCNGSNVILNRTPITSKRFPRPYKPNATAEEFTKIKNQQRITNNKTCQEFIKQVYKIITMGYKKDPRRFVDLGYETRIEIDTSYMPKTYAVQQMIDGIEEGLAQLKTYTASEKDIFTVIQKSAIYADGIDCYKHTVTNSVAPFDKTTDEIYTVIQQQVIEKDETFGTYTKVIQKPISYFKQPSYYIEVTDEVMTWKPEYRDKGNTSYQIYCNDVKEHISSEKIKEADEITNWLAEHDMLDMHAIHCPVCGKPMSVYTGCSHCNYELPKEAISEYINGRITETELLSMSPEEIANIFLDTETHTSYAEWQEINDFRMEGENELYADFK